MKKHKLTKPAVPGMLVRVYSGINGNKLKFGKIITSTMKIVDIPNEHRKLREILVLKGIKDEVTAFDAYFCLDENKVIWQND